MRGSRAVNTKQIGATTGDVENAVLGKRAAIVDTQLDAAAVVEVGDANDAGQRQGSMRCGQVVHVVGFAVGGRLAMESGAVPGGNPLLHIIVIDLRIVPDPLDLIGLAYLVEAGRTLGSLGGLGDTAILHTTPGAGRQGQQGCADDKISVQGARPELPLADDNAHDIARTPGCDPAPPTCPVVQAHANRLLIASNATGRAERPSDNRLPAGKPAPGNA